VLGWETCRHLESILRNGISYTAMCASVEKAKTVCITGLAHGSKTVRAMKLAMEDVVAEKMGGSSTSKTGSARGFCRSSPCQRTMSREAPMVCKCANCCSFPRKHGLHIQPRL
jgi:hypothetical protein